MSLNTQRSGVIRTACPVAHARRKEATHRHRDSHHAADPLYKKRTAIVTGAEEAPEREDEEEEDDEEEEEAEAAEEVKGIPDFWLCVLRNHEVTEEQVRCPFEMLTRPP